MVWTLRKAVILVVLLVLVFLTLCLLGLSINHQCILMMLHYKQSEKKPMKIFLTVKMEKRKKTKMG